MTTTWDVNTETEWFNNASGSDVDVRTTIDSGSLKLMGKNAVGWWSFDTGSNSDGTTDIVDLTSFDNTGTHNNFDEDEWTSDQWSGGSVDLDGTNDDTADYIDIPDDSSISALTDIIVMHWVKSDVGTSARKRINSKEGEWYLGMDSSKASFQIYREGDWHGSCPAPNTTTNIDDGNWHLVTGIYDQSDGEIMIYIDGSLESTESIGSYSANDSSNGIIIGTHSGLSDWSESWDGQIDEGKVFDRILSANEISRIYNRTSPSSMTGSDMETGKWTSEIWDSGDASVKQISSFEVNSTVNTSTEEVLLRVGVDTNDDGTIDEWSHTSGNGVDVTGGNQTFNDSDFNLSPGYRYQAEFTLSVTNSDTTHSPSVGDYTLMTVISLLTGTITVDGSSTSGVDVYAWNKIDGTFVGHTTTAADGTYSIEVGTGDEILVAVDYDSGTVFYGDEKSIQT